MANIPKLKEPVFFDNTQWSTILKAQSGGEQTRFAALERLLKRYRQPIIVYIRFRQRCTTDEAEELAHQFIEHWMRKDLLKSVAPEKGGFRPFVRMCIDNFLVSLHRKGASGKRSPEGGIVSIDETRDGMPVYQTPATDLNPENEMDRAWARAILGKALKHLEKECAAAGRRNLVAVLKPSLGGVAGPGGYASLGVRLGMSEVAVKTAAHRLRQRFGELIQEEVKETVGTHEDWQEELRYLIELMGKS